MRKILSVLEFLWFKVREEVNSFEARLTPWINDSEQVHFSVKRCGEFTATFYRHNCPSMNLY